MTNGGSDPVADGIARWHETKKQAEESMRLCRVAEVESHRLRGENDALRLQAERDNAELRQLRGLYEEARALVGAAGSCILNLMEKMQAGQFRAAHSQLTAVAEAIEAPEAPAQGDTDRTPRIPRFDRDWRTEEAWQADAETAAIGARFGANNRPATS